jgi:hypothetical protein
MMKFLFFTLLPMIFTSIVVAQECSTQLLLQKPGIWKEGKKGSQGGTAAELQKEKKNIAAIHTMIKSKYTPTGVEAIFHGAYNPIYANMAGNSYYYSIIPLNYYCDGNTIKTAHETGSYFEIAANHFESQIYDTAQGDRLLMEGFNVMYDLPVLKDGYWFFKEINVSLGMGVTGKRAMWLITYDGKLPYSHVTRKEFLEKRIKALTVQKEMAAAGFKEALKNIETEKSFKEKEFKNEPAKMSQYMKMDYLQLKARYEKLLAENDSKFVPAFTKIANQLRMPEDELSLPATVKDDPNDHLSYLFTNDDDPFGKNLIKPNPAYFNKKLSKSSAQFFMVYIRANDKEPIAAKFMADVIKGVDFSLLKNMLGK